LANKSGAPIKDREPADILRKEIGFIWRIHVMSDLMVRAVSINITPGYGLTLVDWRIVITLARAPELTAREIIELWGLEKMAVSRSVRHLLKMGLIGRARDSADSRRRPLRLTKKGGDVYRAAWPTAEEHYRMITSVLTAGELKQFNAIADKLVARAREIIDLYYRDAISGSNRPNRKAARPMATGRHETGVF
jgi:DNA-binding MarR family transcriptional regulator